MKDGRIMMSSLSMLAGGFSSNNEAERVMASEVQKKIHELFSCVVPKIFIHPANIPDDTVLEVELLHPLETLWKEQEITALLQENTSTSNFCGKVFKNGEPCVFCK